MHSDIRKTIEILGQDNVSCLRAVFKQLSGTPPQISKQRYRADHPELIDTLDALELTHNLLGSDDERKIYTLRPYAVPLVQTQESEALLSLMCDIYAQLKTWYVTNLNQRIPAIEIAEKFNLPRNEVFDALYYMCEAHGVWASKSLDFPYGDKSTISISETILKKNSFIEVLTEYYRWHFLNPKEELSQANINRLFEKSGADVRRFFAPADADSYPSWFSKLGFTEKALIIEIDKSLAANLNALPVMGIRALIENVMVSRIGDHKSFSNNLKEFSRQGYLTSQHAELLATVIDAGSAVIHRAHIPSTKDVSVCIEVVKHLLHGIHILKPQVDELKMTTPSKK